MCTRVSEEVDHNGSTLDGRRSLDIQESVKSDIAEIRHEMCTKENQMQKTIESIVSKCMEEKLDAFLTKLREKGNWKRSRETTTALLIPAVLKMDDL